MPIAHRKSNIVALLLAALPVILACSLPLLPWRGEWHLSNSIVYPSRAAFFIAILFSVASLVLSVRALRARLSLLLPLVSLLLAIGFLVWASPLAYSVIAAITCGAC